MFKLAEGERKSLLKLKNFSYGEIIFEFDGDREEMLVIADAWHPFWKATNGKDNFLVIRVNDIFKGIRLPPGAYDFSVFFDTSPYRTGIYICLVIWIIFLLTIIFILVNRVKQPHLNRTIKV